LVFLPLLNIWVLKIGPISINHIMIYNHDASAMVTIKGDFGESGSFCCFAPILQPRFLAAAWATTFGDPLLPDCLRRAGLPGENLFPRQVYDRDHRKGTV
jgi:hypothetical protein